MADEPQNPADFLDQSEIDKLLAQNGAEAAPKRMLIRADGSRVKGEETVKVEPYDFRNPSFLSEVELRRLRLVHEDFIRYLSARLSLLIFRKRRQASFALPQNPSQAHAAFSTFLSVSSLTAPIRRSSFTSGIEAIP